MIEPIYCFRCNKEFCGCNLEHTEGLEKILVEKGKKEWHCRQCLLDLNMAKSWTPPPSFREQHPNLKR